MIHALLFVTANNKDREGHGPEFQKHMNRINAATGANITVIIINPSVGVIAIMCVCVLPHASKKIHVLVFMQYINGKLT